MSRELEDDGDQKDASYPESGRHCEHPMQDDEETGDDEPSLGSLNDMHGNGARYHAAGGVESTDCEDEPAEGPLETNEDGDGNPDDAPTASHAQLHQQLQQSCRFGVLFSQR